MLLEDITEIAIGVVLKRKEAKYQTNDTYKYRIFNIKSYEEKIEYDLFYSNENLENFVANKNDGDFIYFNDFNEDEIELAKGFDCLVWLGHLKEKEDCLEFYLYPQLELMGPSPRLDERLTPLKHI